MATGPYSARSDALLEAVRQGARDELPYHPGHTCYWLATVALREGRFSAAMALLEITKAFGEAMARDYATMGYFKYCGTSLKSNSPNRSCRTPG